MVMPISGLSTLSAPRVSVLQRGVRRMSHTSTWWYAFTRGCSSLSTPTAHLSHQ